VRYVSLVDYTKKNYQIHFYCLEFVVIICRIHKHNYDHS